MEPAVKPGYEIGRGEDGLTTRERQVLFLIREGHNGGEIGRRLGLSKQRVAQIRIVLVEKGVLRQENSRTWTVVLPNS